jgi:radial spoke head protein 4A
LDDNLKRETLIKYLEEYIKNINPKKSLLAQPMQPPEEGSEAEPTPITSVNFVNDYYELFQKISWCGISLSEKESFLLTNSIRNLSAKLQMGMFTFFGKIYGTEKDYYILQASEIDAPEGFNYDNDMEHRKEDGINQFVYYVTNDLTSDWVELPDIKPSQLIGSRLIRYTFTGNLNKQIITNPHFNGKESDYLRCQISRIYHGAKLVPSLNHYNIEDPENPFKAFVLNEKPKHFTHEDLTNLKNWIHYPPGILKQGRISHFLEQPEAAEGEEQQDPEEFKKKELEKDPFDKRIKPCIEDNKIQIKISGNNSIKIIPWKLSQYFEDNIYVNPYIKLLDEKAPDFDPLEQKDNKSDYSIICVKSLLWPGAYNFYFNKTNYFMYFGYGLKFEDIPKNGPFVYKDFPFIPNDENDIEDPEEPFEPEIKDEPPEGEEGEEEGKEGEEKKEGEEEEQQPAEGEEAAA